MRDIAAADVERPGDRMRIADNEGIDSAELFTNAREFLRCGFACQLLGIEGDRTTRRRRPIGPNFVYRICLDANEFGAFGGEFVPVSVGLGRSMNPRVVADALAFFDLFSKPRGPPALPVTV